MSLNAPWFFPETPLAVNSLKHVWPFAHPSQVLGLPGRHRTMRTAQVGASLAMTSFCCPQKMHPSGSSLGETTGGSDLSGSDLADELMIGFEEGVP